MKFDHNFTQTTATPTGRTYAADGWQAQLDFLSGSCLRVALYRNAGCGAGNGLHIDSPLYLFISII